MYSVSLSAGVSAILYRFDPVFPFKKAGVKKRHCKAHARPHP